MFTFLSWYPLHISNISVMIHSFYTAIALWCQYIDYSLVLQVTAASPHNVFNFHANKQCSDIAIFYCRVQCGSITQLRHSMFGLFKTCLPSTQPDCGQCTPSKVQICGHNSAVCFSEILTPNYAPGAAAPSGA